MLTLTIPAAPYNARTALDHLLTGRYEWWVRKTNAKSVDVAFPLVWGARRTEGRLRINRDDFARLQAAKVPQ